MVEVGPDEWERRRAEERRISWMLSPVFVVPLVIAAIALAVWATGVMTKTPAERVEDAARVVGADPKLALLIRLAAMEGWGGVDSLDWPPERIAESLVLWQREFTMNRELQLRYREYGYPFIAFVCGKLAKDGRWMELYWYGRQGIGQFYALDIRDIRSMVVDGYWTRGPEDSGRATGGKERPGEETSGRVRKGEMLWA